MKFKHLFLLATIVLLMSCTNPEPESEDSIPPTLVTAETNTPPPLPLAESEVPLPTEKTEVEPEPESESDTNLITIIVDPIEGLLSSSYFGSYDIKDPKFGTDVMVTVDTNTNTRTIVTNALPNHETGEFPNDGNPNAISAQERTWIFPTVPEFRGMPTGAVITGVAINGIKLQPNTAERAICDNGEVYNLEAIQDVDGVGLDFNNAHVQPTGEYHYHGVSELLVEAFNVDQDLVHVAFAADGHMIYYSKSGAYSPSYRLGTGERSGINCVHTRGGEGGTSTLIGSIKDGTVHSDWEYDASYGDLDECNGTTIAGEYIYLITHDYPYISRCLMGNFTEDRPGSRDGQQGGQPPSDDEGEGRGDRPNFTVAAQILGISEDVLREAVGGPPPDFEAASATLGISVEDLQNAFNGR